MTTWPKQLPSLTPEQEAIRDDFMRHWHEVLPKRFGIMERFNHGYARIRRRDVRNGRINTLEIGAGLGAHILSEDLSLQDYTALELRESMAARIRGRFPTVNVLVGDIQRRLPLPSDHFDRVVAVHVLEHLPNLPAALEEIRRVLKPTGRFSAVIPCEGSKLYSLAREISAKRIFERRYRTTYDWCIQSEHVSNYWEIVAEIRRAFDVVEVTFWPSRVPIVHLNIAVGITCVRRDRDASRG